MKSTWKYALVALLGGPLVGLVACSDDSSSSNPGGSTGGDRSTGGGSSGGGGAGGEGGEGSGGEDAVYAVVTQVFGESDNTSYIVTTQDLSGSELSLASGIEINGRAIAAGPTNGGRLFVGTDLGATVTRYDLTADGDLERAGQVSFAGAGLTSLGEYAGQFQFVAEDKAYFFDGSTAQVIVWNPEKMTYTKSLDLSSLVFDGELLTFGGVPLRVGGELLAFAGWRTNDNAQVPDRAAVILVDTETDAVTIATDERCGYVRDGVLAEDGFVYLATEAFGAAVHHMNEENASPPCLLRFDPEAGEFDESFHVDLTTLFDDAVAGTLLIGPGNQPYLLALDAAEYEGPPVPRVLASSPVWRLAKLTTGDAPSVELLDGDPLPGSILPAAFGDDVYLPVFAGRESTEIVELEAAGLGAVAASTPGLAFSFVKLR